jgi:hypothetical protein
MPRIGAKVGRGLLLLEESGLPMNPTAKMFQRGGTNILIPFEEETHHPCAMLGVDGWVLIEA